MEREIPVLYKRKEECCGCTACYAICPKEAISMVEDEEGFEYPRIDESKCVRCSLRCSDKSKIFLINHTPLHGEQQATVYYGRRRCEKRI